MQTPATIEDELRQFISEKLVYGPLKVDNDTKLVQEGIIDSLGVLEVSEFMKEKYGIETAEGEITPANFATVNLMAGYVRRKAVS